MHSLPFFASKSVTNGHSQPTKFKLHLCLSIWYVTWPRKFNRLLIYYATTSHSLRSYRICQVSPLTLSTHFLKCLPSEVGLCSNLLSCEMKLKFHYFNSVYHYTVQLRTSSAPCNMWHLYFMDDSTVQVWSLVHPLSFFLCLNKLRQFFLEVEEAVDAKI